MFFGYCIKISTEITPIRNRGRNTGERLTLRGQVITAHKLRRGFSWLRKRRTYIEVLGASFCAFDVGGCVRRRTLTGPVGICFAKNKNAHAGNKRIPARAKLIF